LGSRRLILNFSTPKAGVAPNSKVIYRFRVPFPFKIAYLKLYAFIGQSYNLRCYIYVGPRGNEQDVNILANVENAAQFFAGDDTSLELLNPVSGVPQYYYITVIYINTSSTDAYTGFCFMVVEEE